VRAIVAQRLVRRLCTACKRPAVLGPNEARMFSAIGIEAPRVLEAQGCPHCKGAGYVGRVGLYEFVGFDDEVRRLIHANANEQEIARYAFQYGEPLLASGLRCAAAGVTSLSDVLRAAQGH
jgi:general secretion pathway protein E